jgi:hypothetical protein
VKGEIGWLAVAGFQAVGVVEGHSVVGLIDEAFATEAGEEAADGFAGEARHAAELFLAELHKKGDGEVVGGGAVAEVVHMCPVEEGTGELAGGGGVEGEATCGEEGAVVLACDGQGGNAADVGVGFHDADKVGAGDGFDGAGGNGFGADAVDAVLLQSGDAEDVSGVRYAEQEEATFCGGSGDFDSATADDQEVIGGEAFAEEDLMGFAMAADADGVEFAQSLRREGAEGLGAENRTVLTAARENGGLLGVERVERRHPDGLRCGGWSAVPDCSVPRDR